MIKCQRGNRNDNIVDHPFWKHWSECSICKSCVQNCLVRRASFSSSIDCTSNSSSSRKAFSHINHEWEKIKSFSRIFFHSSGIKHYIVSHLHSDAGIGLNSEFSDFEGKFSSMPVHRLARGFKLFFNNHFCVQRNKKYFKNFKKEIQMLMLEGVLTTSSIVDLLFR